MILKCEGKNCPRKKDCWKHNKPESAIEVVEYKSFEEACLKEIGGHRSYYYFEDSVDKTVKDYYQEMKA